MTTLDPKTEASNNSSDGEPPKIILSEVEELISLNRPQVSRLTILIMGVVLMMIFILDLYLIYRFWPSPQAASDEEIAECESVFQNFCVDAEERMLILVLLSGVLGNLIHTATSFSNYVGDRKLEKSWIWWYALRPFIGAAVALTFYLVFRGGLLTAASVENLNAFGVMTLAVLAGLFTDRATLKLKEVFETLFKPDDNRTGALDKKNKEDSQTEKAKT